MPDLGTPNRIWLGTAGWNVPSTCRERVGSEGSHLKRYAQVMNAVEINTSFYRPHRRTTYERWARATPDAFRFAIKAPKAVTHTTGFACAELDRFLDESAGLGKKLAVILIQLWSASRVMRAGLRPKSTTGLPGDASAALLPIPRGSAAPTVRVDGKA